jgi:hypothetical protein
LKNTSPTNLTFEEEAKLLQLMPRQLTDKQKNKFIQSLQLKSGSIGILYEVGCSDCTMYAEDFNQTISNIKGWHTESGGAINLGLYRYGVAILYKGEKPSAQVFDLKNAFEAAEIEFEILNKNLGPASINIVITPRRIL